MRRTLTVGDALQRVRERRRSKRCPDCDAVASVRGFDGQYRWACTDCDAVGIGFTSRGDAMDALRRSREQ